MHTALVGFSLDTVHHAEVVVQIPEQDSHRHKKSSLFFFVKLSYPSSLKTHKTILEKENLRLKEIIKFMHQCSEDEGHEEAGYQAIKRQLPNYAAELKMSHRVTLKTLQKMGSENFTP